MIERIWPYLAVLCIGSAWGLTIPLTKVIVSDGYLFFGLIFWQQVICASVLGIVLLVQRRAALVCNHRLRGHHCAKFGLLYGCYPLAGGVFGGDYRHCTYVRLSYCRDDGQ